MVDFGRKIWTVRICIKAVLLSLVGFPTPLSAMYLDPGTGSFIAQLVAAVVLGGLASIRSVREKTAMWLKKLLPGRRGDSPDEDAPR